MKWENNKISDVCEVGDGAHASIKRHESGVLYLTSKNFKADGIDFSKIDFISREDFEKHFREGKSAIVKPKENDLLMSIIGSIGAPYLVRDQDEFGLSSSVSILRPNTSKIWPKFLYYWIRSEVFQTSLNNIKSGVAQSFLSLSMIRSLPVKYPNDIKSQQKIASILSAYDDLIENNLKRIRLLEEAAQRLYQEWFVRFRFPGWEEAEFGPNGLPVGWERVKIGDELDQISRRPKIRREDYKLSGRIPIVDQADGDIAGYTDDETYRHEFPLPILVFGDHTRRIKFVDSPFASGADGTQLLYPKNPRLLPAYFYFVVKSINLSNYAYARHFKYLKEEEMLIPDENSLKEFNMYAYLFLNQVASLRKQNQKLKEARDLLLPRLMDQRIEV
jgi:type I restriction enzyme S subunit